MNADARPFDKLRETDILMPESAPPRSRIFTPVMIPTVCPS
jgi:hypothetical protein